MNGTGRVCRAVLVLATTLGVAALFAASPGLARRATKTPYKIGAIFSVTGDNSPLGQPEKETALLLEQQINAKGGIDGHPVQILVEDDAGQETKAVLAARKLVERDKVIAIVGPSLSGTTLSIVDYMERKQVPLISCAASVKIVEPADKRHWIFKTPQSDRHAVERIGAFLKHRNVSRVAFINVSNAYGTSGLDQAKAILPKMGMEIVAAESFGPDDTDMTPQLTRIKASKAQALICWGTNPGPARVMKNARQLGLKMYMIQSHGVANQTFIDLAGDASHGVIFPAGRLIVLDQIPKTDPQYGVLKQYSDLYTAKYHKAPNTFGGHAWDALTLLFDALDRVGTDRAKIRSYIEGRKNFVGTGGVFSFSPQDHNGLTRDAFAIVKIENGKWIRIE
jgi:branched-chain amino acid transport system substrate-binding protein